MKLLLTLLLKLGRKRKYQLFFLLILSLASAFSELISLGAVVPFLAALSDTDSSKNSAIFNFFITNIPFLSQFDVILASCLIFAGTSVFASIIRGFNLWANQKTAAVIGHDISKMAYSSILHQRYLFFTQNNSSEYVNILIAQINRTVVGLSSFLQLITSSVVSVSILLAITLSDIRISFSLVFIFGFSYLFILSFLKNKLVRSSAIIASSSKAQIKSVQESLSTIRPIIVDKAYSYFENDYQLSDKKLRSAYALNNISAFMPRFILESLSIAYISSLGYWLVTNGYTNSEVLSILGLLALGSQRLLPSVQQIYSSWAQIKSFTSDFNGVLGALSLPIPEHSSLIADIKNSSTFNSIEFKNISFTYPNSLSPALQSVNLTIDRGDRVALIGKTGSGKSTILDILLGLLPINAGSFSVNIDNNIISSYQLPDNWCNLISYVPQRIFLIDKTILENVAFGVPLIEIDFNLVVECCKVAQISSFIDSLNENYYTKVGEDGVLLSGGQIQRIGIARALYKKSQIIVLDEATSALDQSTEKNLMESIYHLNRNITFVIVAHRLSTLRPCNKVYEMQDRGILRSIDPSKLFD